MPHVLWLIFYTILWCFKITPRCPSKQVKNDLGLEITWENRCIKWLFEKTLNQRGRLTKGCIYVGQASERWQILWCFLCSLTSFVLTVVKCTLSSKLKFYPFHHVLNLTLSLFVYIIVFVYTSFYVVCWILLVYLGLFCNLPTLNKLNKKTNKKKTIKTWYFNTNWKA